jgi:hypothetical protein
MPSPFAAGLSPPYRATVVSIETAAKLANDLPDVTVGTHYGNRTWLVGKKAFAWDRPFSKADLRRFGDAPIPSGPIFAVRVADLRTKELLLAAKPRGVFTIPHFDGYAAVLIQLDKVALRTLRQMITDAWLASATPKILAAHRKPSRA